MKKFQITVTAEQDRQLREEAKAEGLSLSALLRKRVQKVLKAR